MCALSAAIGESGRRVAPFKAGPDYLDATFHRVIADHPCRNLDGWMMGRGAVEHCLVRGSRGRDVALIEGVMGLFDGRDPATLEGSAAELAIWLEAPVILVVDASAMARSAAALVEGFADHVAGVNVAGVIFNRVGSDKHGDLLRTALTQTRKPIPCLGALPREPSQTFASRHLGLVSADLQNVGARRKSLAAWAQAHLNIEALMAVAQSAPVLDFAEHNVTPDPPPCTRIAYAYDEAFHFYYEDNFDLLKAAGAELVPFSPLHDPAVPPADGMLLGGGYPEVHAATLAANTAMRESVRAFAASGKPVYAECGGYMYLGETLTDKDGTAHSMCSVLPLQTRMRDRLTALGYREIELLNKTPLGTPGTPVRGHEFHYSEHCAPPQASAAFGTRSGERWGAQQGNVVASYLHLHWSSQPSVASSFVNACVKGDAQ